MLKLMKNLWNKYNTWCEEDTRKKREKESEQIMQFFNELSNCKRV